MPGLSKSGQGAESNAYLVSIIVRRRSGGLPPGLRPGMEGIGKVVVGERSLLWIWTHGFFDWLRLALWNWMP